MSLTRNLAIGLVALFAMALPACHDTAFGPGPGGDGPIRGANGVACCPIDDTPSCDCTRLGGSADPDTGQCLGNSICDAVPEGWKKAVDDNGCPMWEPSGSSCLDGWDPPPPPPPPPVQCCPMGTPSCDCPELGGSPDPVTGECNQRAACDVPPVGWTTTEDENGCPMLVEPRTGDSCLDGWDPDPPPPVECCPIGEPSCDCTDLGGSPDPTTGECGFNNICDAAPVGWTMTTDENGCPMWEPGGESCFPPEPPSCEGQLATSDLATYDDATALCDPDSGSCSICAQILDQLGNPCLFSVFESRCECPTPSISAGNCGP